MSAIEHMGGNVWRLQGTDALPFLGDAGLVADARAGVQTITIPTSAAAHFPVGTLIEISPAAVERDA